MTSWVPPWRWATCSESPTRDYAGTWSARRSGARSAPCHREVHVVEMAVSGRLRTRGRVVRTSPDHILQPEAPGVGQRVGHDLVAERDALGAAGVGDHDVDGQP